VPCDRAPTISLRLEIVKRSDDTKGFVVLPRRWLVERTFSWFGGNRRLVKDFENFAETLGAFVALASIQLASGGLPGRRSPTQQTAGLHGTVVKVCKSDRERTVAGTRGNGEVAPIADLHSTRAWGMPLSGSYAASLCLCIGLQLASSLIILCAPRVREPVGVIERG
jgi:hypothetical protein